MRRIRGYMEALLLVTILLGLILAILAFVQYAWHPFDGIIDFINRGQNAAGERLSTETIAGISVGTLALTFFLSLVPVLSKGVNKKQYFSSFMRSLLAAFVYFLTEQLYKVLESYGRFYMLFAIVSAAIVTFILIEIVVRAGKIEKEVAVRTDLLAAIASGLAFGIIVRLVTFGIGSLAGMISR